MLAGFRDTTAGFDKRPITDDMVPVSRDKLELRFSVTGYGILRCLTLSISANATNIIL